MAKAAQHIVKFVPDEAIIRRIYIIREQKVMLDFDLASLYEVETKALNQAVKRNSERFPEDFMFRLTPKEWQYIRSQNVTTQGIHSQSVKNMRSQIVTAYQAKRNVSVTPYAFTEHGITMLASVLKSNKAIKMSIAVVRIFIELKKSALQYTEIAEQLNSLKQRLGEHDVQLNQIYSAIENLLDEKTEAKTWEGRERIGFKK